MTAESVGGGDTGTIGVNASGRDRAGEPDLAPRVARLETMVSGLALVLERLESGGEPLDGMSLDDFDDPGASNEALDLVFESFSDARRDLAVLRHAVPLLAAAPFSSPQRTVLVGVEEQARSAAGLAEAFETYRRSVDQRVPPRTPGGIARLDEFLAMIVRALRDVAAVVDPATFAPPVAAAPAPVLPPLDVVLAATAPPLPEPPRALPLVAAPRPAIAPAARASIAQDAAAPAGQATRSAKPKLARASVLPSLWRHLQRRRTRLMVESAALVVVALVILVSALRPGGPPTGASGAIGSPSGTPGSATGGPVAVGDGSSPRASPSPDGPRPVAQTARPTAPRETSGPAATTPPRATPRPTQGPNPTPEPSIPAGQFADRISAAADQIDGFLATITTAVKASDFVGARGAAVSMATVSSTERTWLEAHPPAECYASSYDTAIARYGDLIATATSIEGAADAGDANAIHQDVGSAHGDVSALKQAASKAVTACA